MENFVVELSDSEEGIRKEIEPLLESEGYELIRLSFKPSQSKSILMLFVDTIDKTNGITVDNLTDISRFLSDVLDASFEDSKLLNNRYELQVSSPGLDRPITKESHFKSAIGQKIKVRLKRNDVGGAKKMVGVLSEVDADGIGLDLEADPAQKTNIRFCEVAEAHIVFEFAQKTKVKKKAE